MRIFCLAYIFRSVTLRVYQRGHCLALLLHRSIPGPFWTQVSFPHVAFRGSRDQSATEGLLVPVCGRQHSIQK